MHFTDVTVHSTDCNPEATLSNLLLPITLFLLCSCVGNLGVCEVSSDLQSVEQSQNKVHTVTVMLERNHVDTCSAACDCVWV